MATVSLHGEAIAIALAQFRREPDLIRNRAVAAHTALLGVAGVDMRDSAAIGFSFGGFAVLDLARSGAPVTAVANFHGLLTTAMPAKRGEVNVRGGYTGSGDPLVPAADVTRFQEEMSQVDVDWQISIYGYALHSFTNKDVGKLGDPRTAYDPLSHNASWQVAMDFLQLSFEQVGSSNRDEDLCILT
ncbi:hypothetical protein D0Z70_23820 [Sphingobium terrigena]|uniref:Dienelactone hydrolase domain-containing protein n=1 Tax=Sphingobium terrigena TaxID=2304063 RepID=A0A418YIA9_9SPHN|nr:dienelactone hydrolase family protein [Sphingobium terrigena]RJG50385.1 hypothetical protein D0Z70_23820 [Sphingobium terrigena]